LESIPGVESLRVLFRVCQRRKGFVFATAAFVLLVSACAAGLATSTYTASSVIQIESPSAGQGSSESDLRARANLLQSEALALKVIADLNLARDQKSPGGPPSVVDAFRARLKVKVIPATHQVEVDYTDGDPKLAAAVVNHLVDVFADETVATTIRPTSQASQWLEGQLSELRRQSETLQSKLIALQMTNELVDPDLHAKPVIYTSTLARLQRSTVLLGQARMNVILTASVAEAVKTGNLALIAQLRGASIASANGRSFRASLILIQQLLRRQATLQMEIDRDSSHLSSSSPQLVRDHASMRILQQSLNRETKRAAERAQADLAVASEAEQDLRAENEVDRAVALQLNDRSMENATLPMEADQSRQLYQGLLKRLKNAGMLEVIHSSNLTVVTKATEASSGANSWAPLYLALGGGFGVFFGCCVALLVDNVAPRKTKDEEGWSLHINGSRIPPIRGMNSAAFKLSQDRYGLTLTQRKQAAVKPLCVLVSRAVTNPGPHQPGHLGQVIVLRPAAGGRTGAMR
jgi:succinoglycan biosynthesis transport protein ExoP